MASSQPVRSQPLPDLRSRLSQRTNSLVNPNTGPLASRGTGHLTTENKASLMTSPEPLQSRTDDPGSECAIVVDCTGMTVTQNPTGPLSNVRIPARAFHRFRLPAEKRLRACALLPMATPESIAPAVPSRMGFHSRQAFVRLQV